MYQYKNLVIKLGNIKHRLNIEKPTNFFVKMDTTSTVLGTIKIEQSHGTPMSFYENKIKSVSEYLPGRDTLNQFPLEKGKLCIEIVCKNSGFYISIYKSL